MVFVHWVCVGGACSLGMRMWCLSTRYAYVVLVHWVCVCGTCSVGMRMWYLFSGYAYVAMLCLFRLKRRLQFDGWQSG